MTTKTPLEKQKELPDSEQGVESYHKWNKQQKSLWIEVLSVPLAIVIGSVLLAVLEITFTPWIISVTN